MTAALVVTAVISIFVLTPVPAIAADDAQSLYQSKCAGCHAPDGGGTVAGKKLNTRDLRSSEVQQQTDAELMGIVEKGKNKMPAYTGKLTEDQIKLMVGHIRSLAKKN